VVLGHEHPYSKDPGNDALKAAKALYESRGTTPRLFRNTLVFLAPDSTRLQDLDEAVRKFLAWESILLEKDTLNLSPHQVKQAEMQLKSADSTVAARMPETYQWLIVPIQNSPQQPVEWQASRLTGQDPIAVRASKKLKNDELLVTSLAGTRLRLEMDRVPLWRGNHVATKQLLEDFAKYPYLPRLSEPSVLMNAISDGLGLLTWQQDSFAYADSFDDIAGRYRGLRGGERILLPDPSGPGLLVKPEIAMLQIQAERAAPDEIVQPTPTGKGQFPAGGVPPGGDQSGATLPVPEHFKPKRFHGSVELDPTRVGRDASRIAEEVIAHLAGLNGAQVKVSLEIEAALPEGASEQLVRTVTENSVTLKFKNHGFEKD